MGSKYGKLIRMHRERMGMSLRALGADAGVLFTRIAKIEGDGGEKCGPFDAAVSARIAKSLGFSRLRFAAATLADLGWNDAARLLDEQADAEEQAACTMGGYSRGDSVHVEFDTGCDGIGL